MSFEGYYQVLCEKGHYHEPGHWDYEHSAFVCGDRIDGERCTAPVAWDNLVNTTNCDEDGKVEVIRLTEPVTERCNLGHDHIISDATFAALTKGALGLLADQAE